MKWATIDYLILARLYFHRRIAGDFKPPPPTSLEGIFLLGCARLVCDAGGGACNDLAGQIMREYWLGMIQMIGGHNITIWSWRALCSTLHLYWLSLSSPPHHITSWSISYFAPIIIAAKFHLGRINACWCMGLNTHQVRFCILITEYGKKKLSVFAMRI